MKAWIAVVMMAALVWGCAKSPGQKAADTYVKGMERIATAMEGITDEASARGAAEVVAAVTKDLEKFSADVEAMSEAEQAALFAPHAKDIQAVQTRIAAAMGKLMGNPEWLQIVTDELGKIPNFQ